MPFLSLFAAIAFTAGLVCLLPPVTHQYGKTPLHYACINDNTDFALALLGRGADLEAKNMVRPVIFDMI